MQQDWIGYVILFLVFCVSPTFVIAVVGGIIWWMRRNARPATQNQIATTAQTIISSIIVKPELDFISSFLRQGQPARRSRAGCMPIARVRAAGAARRIEPVLSWHFPSPAVIPIVIAVAGSSCGNGAGGVADRH